jgi:hypothetical protein
MNIIQLEDIAKGLPDDALLQQAQNPSGELPQWLSLSEIQRRVQMRESFQAQQQDSQGTIADQIIQKGSANGIASLQPQQQMVPPQNQGFQPPPQQMAGGGIVQMQHGGRTPLDDYSQPLYPAVGASIASNFVDNQIALGDFLGWMGQKRDLSNTPFATGLLGDRPERPPMDHEIRALGPALQTQVDAFKAEQSPQTQATSDASVQGDTGGIAPLVDEAEVAATVPASGGYGTQTAGEAGLASLREKYADPVSIDRSELQNKIRDRIPISDAHYADLIKEQEGAYSGYGDMIEDANKDAWSQAMIQVGSGIAGDNLSQGLSRAGILGLRAKDKARWLDMQDRQGRMANDAKVRALKAQQFAAVEDIEGKALALESQTITDEAAAESSNRQLQAQMANNVSAREIQRIGIAAQTEIQQGRNNNEAMRLLRSIIQGKLDTAFTDEQKQETMREIMQMVPDDVASLIFSPEYIKQFQTPGAGGVPRLSSDPALAAKEYENLPSGAEYIDPNGIPRTK